MLYGRPGTGIVDYDFKGMHYQRAYWIAQGIKLHLSPCQVAAPELSWPEWDAIAENTKGELLPLAEEAQRRFSEPLLQAMASASDPHRT